MKVLGFWSPWGLGYGRPKFKKKLENKTKKIIKEIKSKNIWLG
jgi:hypothetical protein